MSGNNARHSDCVQLRIVWQRIRSSCTGPKVSVKTHREIDLRRSPVAILILYLAKCELYLLQLLHPPRPVYLFF